MRSALALWALAVATLAGPARLGADCVDPELKARLIEQKRGRRLDQRDFVKQARHELTLNGGYYVSDLLDSTFVVGGAYTYHLTEDAAIEASFGYSRISSSLARTLERDRGVVVLPATESVYLAFADLVWSPIHGKLQLFADRILHFDVYAVAGVGAVHHASSLGAAGQFGIGIKTLLGRSWAVRLDLRDQLYRQQVLSERGHVNDVSLTLGVSLFLPTGM